MLPKLVTNCLRNSWTLKTEPKGPNQPNLRLWIIKIAHRITFLTDFDPHSPLWHSKYFHYSKINSFYGQLCARNGVTFTFNKKGDHVAKIWVNIKICFTMCHKNVLGISACGNTLKWFFSTWIMIKLIKKTVPRQVLQHHEQICFVFILFFAIIWSDYP